MPVQHKAGDQVTFLSQWFASWSEMQREDFLPILVQAYHPKGTNGLAEATVGMEGLDVKQRRPSLFDCQTKLFRDWILRWTDDERSRFLIYIRTEDPPFMARLEQLFPGAEGAEGQSNSSDICVTVDAEENGNGRKSPAAPGVCQGAVSPSASDSGLDEPVDRSEPHSLASEEGEASELQRDDCQQLLSNVRDSNGVHLNTSLE